MGSWPRQFAIRHPSGLTGLVLVDPSHASQLRRMARFKYHDRLQLWRSAARDRLRASGVMRAAQDLGIRDRPTEPVVIAQAVRGGAVQELINHALIPPWYTPPNLGDLPLR